MLAITIFMFICELHIFALGEVFTAISDVEPLLYTNKRIIEDLDDYIKKEEARLERVKGQLYVYKREHDKAMEDIGDYLGNPINAFTLIKRLTTDLDFIEESIEIGTDYIRNAKNFKNHTDVKYPTLEDLTGAAQALTRLQKTYHLDIADLAEGKLNGVIHRDNADTGAVCSTMSAGDCYELGKALYNEKDYKNGLAWMMVALRKYADEGLAYPFTEVDILEYISFSHYLLGDLKRALEWGERVVALEPDHPRVRDNIDRYRVAIDKEEEKQQQIINGTTGDEGNLGEESQQSDTKEWPDSQKDRYEALCRGEMKFRPDVIKKLKCRYMTENHPFLKLAPIKMEYMYLGPDIVLFHDVLSDDEIDHIKELAKPRFKRALVNVDENSIGKPVSYRISKTAWLHDEESTPVARVSRRVEDFTGMSLETAEELQVVNYGIGGHYEPHLDFSRDKEKVSRGGNRIATVLFYMSDVAQGGATVFTELGLSVFPVRGAAVVWLNLHASGEGDLATRHAACPVLRGSKWVCTKWLHQNGQELRKPCGPKDNIKENVRRLAKPLSKIIS